MKIQIYQIKLTTKIRLMALQNTKNNPKNPKKKKSLEMPRALEITLGVGKDT